MDILVSLNENDTEIFNTKDIVINDTTLIIHRNIESYDYEKCFPKLNTQYKTLYDSGNIIQQYLNNTNYYFIFDCPGEDAFGHWVYESFMFYSLFFELKKKCPNLKIFTKNKKKYVKLLFDFFDMTDYFTDEFNATQQNVCFFPPVISLNELKDLQLFSRYVDIYSNSIETKLMSFNAKSKCVFLPRNTVDNYAPNDRSVPLTDEIKKYTVEMGGTVLNTYDLNNLTYQYNIIQNSDFVILDYGSSFVCNCIFLKNKKIILLHNIDLGFYLSFPANRLLYEYICNRNTVFHVNIFTEDGELKNIKNIFEDKHIDIDYYQPRRSDVFIYGDSHANFNFAKLPYFNFYENSITMHRIGRDNKIINFNQFAHDSNSIIILCYGEVDCRCHIEKQINLGRKEDDIINELVDKYFVTIKNNIKIYKKIIICAVPPPISKEMHENIHGEVKHEFPFLGTDMVRVHYTHKVNEMIKKKCEIYNYIYFDPYDAYKEENGLLKFNLSDTFCHIKENSHIIKSIQEIIRNL